MKIETDQYGRRVYKFSSSVAQGGYLYAHKTKEGNIISNKFGLQNLLTAIAIGSLLITNEQVWLNYLCK